MIFKSADIDIEDNNSHEQEMIKGEFLLWLNKTMVNSLLIENIIENLQYEKKLLVLSKKILIKILQLD